MVHESMRVIIDEHSALSAMLRSLIMMMDRGPLDDRDQFFDVLRAMLFYVDEFPERLHHLHKLKRQFGGLTTITPKERLRFGSCSTCCWPGSCWVNHEGLSLITLCEPIVCSIWTI